MLSGHVGSGGLRGDKWAQNGMRRVALVPSTQAMPLMDRLEGPRGLGPFLRMRIVLCGRFCTKIGMFN